MERGIEKLGYDKDGCGVLFASFATGMPNIAKIDAVASGFYAFPDPGQGERIYVMDVDGELRRNDMDDTMEWMLDAEIIEDFRFDGDVLTFTVSADAIDAMGIRIEDVLGFNREDADFQGIIERALSTYMGSMSPM